MKQNRIFLDSYVLQQDMRIRMPKAILENINAIKGKTIFDVFYDAEEDAIVLKRKQEKRKINEWIFYKFRSMCLR